MFQEDYILRLIEILTIYLQDIVFNIRHHNYDLALHKINQTYKRLLHVDPDGMKHKTTDEIIECNTHNDVLEKDNIEVIANLLFLEAFVLEQIHKYNESSFEFYQKSFELFYLLYGLTENKKYTMNINEVIPKLGHYYANNDVIYKMYKYYLKTGQYGKAEDTLFYLMENDYPEIKNKIALFYSKLMKKDDTVLEKGNLPRDEIINSVVELGFNSHK